MLSQRTLDNITLEGEYKYPVYITIQPPKRKNEDYQIKLEFINLNENDFYKVHELYKLNKSLEISSDLIKQNGYDISHIVTNNISTNQFQITWDCFSDVPGEGLILN